MINKLKILSISAICFSIYLCIEARCSDGDREEDRKTMWVGYYDSIIPDDMSEKEDGARKTHEEGRDIYISFTEERPEEDMFTKTNRYKLLERDLNVSDVSEYKRYEIYDEHCIKILLYKNFYTKIYFNFEEITNSYQINFIIRILNKIHYSDGEYNVQPYYEKGHQIGKILDNIHKEWIDIYRHQIYGLIEEVEYFS